MLTRDNSAYDDESKLEKTFRLVDDILRTSKAMYARVALSDEFCLSTECARGFAVVKEQQQRRVSACNVCRGWTSCSD